MHERTVVQRCCNLVLPYWTKISKTSLELLSCCAVLPISSPGPRGCRISSCADAILACSCPIHDKSALIIVQELKLVLKRISSRATDMAHTADSVDLRVQSVKPRELSGVQPPPNDGPEWQLVTLHRFMVLPEAWDGWAIIHVKPLKAFAFAMSISCFGLMYNACILFWASQPFGWGLLVPCILYCVSHVAMHLLIWRWGPKVTKTKRYFAFGFAMTGCQTYVTFQLLTGPDEYVLFGNRLALTIITAVGMWAIHITGAMGCWYPDHPPEPHRYSHTLSHTADRSS